MVNPANPFVLLPHLSCAAHERPLTPDDEAYWGPPHVEPGVLDDAVRQLVLDDTLVLRNQRAVYAGRGSPGLRLSSRA